MTIRLAGSHYQPGLWLQKHWEGRTPGLRIWEEQSHQCETYVCTHTCVQCRRRPEEDSLELELQEAELPAEDAGNWASVRYKSSRPLGQRAFSPVPRVGNTGVWALLPASQKFLKCDRGTSRMGIPGDVQSMTILGPSPCLLNQRLGVGPRLCFSGQLRWFWHGQCPLI